MGQYVESQARQNLVVEMFEVMDMAKEIYASTARKAGVENPEEFVTSKVWLYWKRMPHCSFITPSQQKFVGAKR